MKRTVGIIGGMGPMATVDLFRKIVENTPAKNDREHIHVLIDNNNDIPDRTKALLENGEDPVPALTASAERLIGAGADCLIMSCNTAHGFLEELQSRVSVPVLNMIRLTREELQRQGITCVGLFATTGTVRTGIYEKELDGIRVLTPDPETEQPKLMELIYDAVKAGVRDYDASAVQAIADRLIRSGAQTIVLGCTELPLAMEYYGLRFPNVDPTLCLAKGAIAFAMEGEAHEA